MADSVLDAVREKYPQYKDVPDDKLTLAIGKKYPQYLSRDEDFANDFKRLSAPQQPQAPLPPLAQAPPPPTDGGMFGTATLPPNTGFKINAPSSPIFPTVMPKTPGKDVAVKQNQEGLLTSLPRATIEDVAAGLNMATLRKNKLDAAQYSGNIPAALMREDLPMDQVIKQVSSDPDNIPAATAAKVATGIAETAPLAVVGALPAWAARLALAGFTADMFKNLPKTATALGDELGKPKDQQDPDKISSLASDAIQQLVFAGTGAKHLESAGRDAIADAMIDKYIPRGTGVPSKPTTIGAPNASSIQAPTEVHGDVQPQPIQSQRQVPTEKGGAGIQPQTENVAKEAQVPLSQQMRQDAARNYGDESKWPKDVKDDIAAQQRKESSKPIEQVNLTGLGKQDIPKVGLPDPEHQRMLDIERGNVDVPVDLVTDKDLQGDDPFVKKMASTLQRSIATIDRKNNRIVVNPTELSAWLNRIPLNQRQQALRSLIGEERIHLATDDSAAGTYWKTLTGIERAIVKRRYGNVSGMNDTLWGHEALRFRMQQLSRMTPREVAEAAGAEKWTVKGLTVLETAIRGIREALGTKASAESKAILDRIQENLNLGKQVASGSSPGAVDKEVQDRAEKEAQELEKHARMYIESGDAESGNELLARAQELRDRTSQQYFPAAFDKQDYSPEDLKRYNQLKERQKALLASGRTLFDDPQMWKDFESLRNKYGGMPPRQLDQQNFPAARPKKRVESIFQDKFILPGMETQKPSGEQMAVPLPGTEAPPVPPEQRVSAEASGALPRLSGREIEARGTTWVRDSIQNALRATQEGKHPAPPKFKDFVDYMKRQEPKLQPGNLYEMWQKSVAGFLDTSSGAELSDLSKSIFGRESMFGRSKITDKPAPGFKLEDIPDRTAAEKYQDERRAARTQQFREKTIGALYKKLVQPQLREEALSAERKTVTPSEVRYGGGDKSNAYQDFDAKAQTDPQLGDMLVDESRRSKDDPASLTKRLTVLQDKRTGAIEMVSTYKHPSQGVVMRDPLSPRGESSPLSSILNRYRVINSVLLDEPVKNFRQSYSSLGDYNERDVSIKRGKFIHRRPATIPSTCQSANSWKRQKGVLRVGKVECSRDLTANWSKNPVAASSRGVKRRR